jgi:hypothetical protein
VFSAFRTHRLQNDIASRLLDENGKLKTFEQFSKDVKGITDHSVKQWLRTEYDTAVIRAHNAADWQQFHSVKDILPNLRWMPTTSVTPDEIHRQFWSAGLTLPQEHPFWNLHRPGDRWNCKCYLEATDAPVKGEHLYNHIATPYKPDKGLDNNPGQDGKLFSDSHPYIANAHKGAKKAVKQFLDAIVEVTEKLFKSGGVLQTPKAFSQNKHEEAKNKSAYTYLAKYFGSRYKLLSVQNIHGKKNPDALNLITGKYSDAKIPVTANGKNAVQNSIKEASAQMVSEVYICLEEEYPMVQIWAGLKAALQKGRAKTIETVIIKFKTGEVKTYDVERLRGIFYKNKGETG